MFASDEDVHRRARTSMDNARQDTLLFRVRARLSKLLFVSRLKQKKKIQQQNPRSIFLSEAVDDSVERRKRTNGYRPNRAETPFRISTMAKYVFGSFAVNINSCKRTDRTRKRADGERGKKYRFKIRVAKL